MLRRNLHRIAEQDQPQQSFRTPQPGHALLIAASRVTSTCLSPKSIPLLSLHIAETRPKTVFASLAARNPAQFDDHNAVEEGDDFEDNEVGRVSDTASKIPADLHNSKHYNCDLFLHETIAGNSSRRDSHIIVSHYEQADVSIAASSCSAR